MMAIPKNISAFATAAMLAVFFYSCSIPSKIGTNNNENPEVSSLYPGMWEGGGALWILDDEKYIFPGRVIHPHPFYNYSEGFYVEQVGEISGQVTANDGQVVSDCHVALVDKYGKVVAEAISSPDGRFGFKNVLFGGHRNDGTFNYAVGEPCVEPIVYQLCTLRHGQSEVNIASIVKESKGLAVKYK
jgi:hypothetical protein